MKPDRLEQTTWNRRDLIRGVGAMALAGSGLACARSQQGPSVEPAAPDFTAAFFTDPHVDGRKGSAEGFAQAVRHAFDRALPPELVVTGGDLSFDILRHGPQGADPQYELFEQGLSGVTVPIHHTMGNHDLLGVYPEAGLEPDHPQYGKVYFTERYGLERPYYSFDHEGWHFVVLDTLDIVDVEPEEDEEEEGPRRQYRGWVGEEQQAWLADDLAAAARPTVVVGHIPLFSNYYEWQRGTEEGIPDRISVVNAHQVAKTLLQHPVRLVLAGHLHINEVFRYKGIEFANLGAVSGNWWDGLRDGFEEGYSLLEFRGDEVSWRYVDYGWEAREPEEPAEEESAA